MAKRGDVIDNPITKQQMTYLQTAADTDGTLLQIEVLMKPSASIVGGVHIHPRQEETFTVRTGKLRYVIDGKERDVGAGEKIVIPSRTPHDWHNATEQGSTVVMEFRPARRYESYFETVFGLARDGKTTAKGFPRLFQAAVIYWDFRDSVRPGQAWLRALMTVLLPIFGPLGKLFGLRSVYSQYSDPDTTPTRPSVREPNPVKSGEALSA